MKNSQMPVARRDGLVIQETQDEVLVYDLTRNEAHCLNRTAASVWKYCDGGSSVSEINNLLEAEFGAPVHEDLIRLAIDRLNERNLLESNSVSGLASRSRREILKKIGLGAVVALPVISSLVAPTGALASTSCACVSPGACITQTSCPSTSNCNGSGICAP